MRRDTYRLTESEAVTVIKEHGGLKEGHFVLSDGLHSAEYLDFGHVARQSPAAADKLGRALAALVEERRSQWEAVCTPSGETEPLARAVARSLGDLPCGYLRKESYGLFTLDAAVKSLVRGKAVLLVDDVFTSGRTVDRMEEEVRRALAKDVGCAILWMRGTPHGDTPLIARPLIDVALEDWRAEDCPLCRAGVPIDTTVGHGARATTC